MKLDKTKVRYGWHFCNDHTLTRDMRPVVEGNTYQALDNRGRKARTIRLCSAGLHASPTPHQAWEYVSGNTVSYVMVNGELSADRNKFAGRYRTHIRVAAITEKSHRRLTSLHRRGRIEEFDALIKEIVG